MPICRGWLFHLQNSILCVPKSICKERRQQCCISPDLSSWTMWYIWYLQAYSWSRVQGNWIIFLETVPIKTITGWFSDYLYFWLEGICKQSCAIFLVHVHTHNDCDCLLNFLKIQNHKQNIYNTEKLTETLNACDDNIDAVHV